MIMTEYPVLLKGMQCTLIELKDDSNGWKVIDEEDNVLIWSAEQSMVLIKDQNISTLHGVIQFKNKHDFE